MRCIPLTVGLLLAATPAGADGPAPKLTPVERAELEARWTRLNTAGQAAFEQRAFGTGKGADAEKSWTDALEVARRLYPPAEYPDGHLNLATSLDNLCRILWPKGRVADAEAHCREALAMRRRLRQGDHADVVLSLD